MGGPRLVLGGLAGSAGPLAVGQVQADLPQAGSAPGIGASGLVVFPKAFSAPPVVIASPYGSGDGAYALVSLVVTPTGFSWSRTTLSAGSTPVRLDWHARPKG